MGNSPSASAADDSVAIGKPTRHAPWLRQLEEEARRMTHPLLQVIHWEYPPALDTAGLVQQSTVASPTTTSPNNGLGSTHTRVLDPRLFETLPPIPAASGSSSNAQRSSSRHTPRSNSYLRAPMRRETAENALETLRKFDTVIIVDDSKSMSGPLWKEASNALAALAQTAGDYDTDGIDVHFLNDERVGRGLKNARDVNRLFNSVRPGGISLIGEKLEELLLQYLDMIEAAKDSGDPATLKAIKPTNFIVITDGVPTDDPESVIVNAAKRLDARGFPLSQLGIQFVQIGQSPKATEFLQELDNGLAATHGIRDIVDTTPFIGGDLTSEVLTKILLGGINRRVDTKGAGAVM
ncbi:VWFA domain-containing protein [Pleurotus pulmonarius]